MDEKKQREIKQITCTVATFTYANQLVLQQHTGTELYLQTNAFNHNNNDNNGMIMDGFRILMKRYVS